MRPTLGGKHRCNPYRVGQDGLGRGVADAIYVLQRELDALLVGNVHTRHTRCLDSEGRPAADVLQVGEQKFDGDPSILTPQLLGEQAGPDVLIPAAAEHHCHYHQESVIASGHGTEVPLQLLGTLRADPAGPATPANVNRMSHLHCAGSPLSTVAGWQGPEALETPQLLRKP